MDDMNTTSNPLGPTGPGPGPNDLPPGPGPAQPSHQDLDRLRRSISDRYIAGVAGGLGRHFNIDPTIFRVLLAVLTLFGGAGVLIYAACWLFVPEEGKDRAALNISSDARKIVLLAAVGIAFLLAVGDAFSGFSAGWPIAAIAVVIAVIMIARDRRTDQPAPKPAHVPVQGPAHVPAQGPVQVPGQDLTAPGYATSYAAGYPDAQYEQTLPPPPVPPHWSPPVITAPILPPHRKRTGILWFWPTLALITIGLGIVGIIDQNHQVSVGVYPAVALAITGVMLLIGSFYGRPGGLILVGIVSAVTLAAATVLGTFHLDGRNLESNPVTAAEVQDEYEVQVGRIYLDLTDVVDEKALAGRTITLDLNAGEITVIVPKSLNVTIDAEMGFAGGIEIPGYEGGGIEDQATRTLAGSPTSTLEPLALDIDVRVGQINVEQR